MGSSNQDAFVLKWNDFHSNIATNFRDLRDDDDFLDVTVACDEDNQLQAHKVILSACSPYFRSVLKKNPAQHPVLIMPANVRYQEIVAMIDFMYHGEVAVPHEDLNTFLETAAQFKVRGLTEERPKQQNQRPPPPAPKSMIPGGPRPPHPSSSPHGIPPGIQQRLPPGIQMVKRRGSEGVQGSGKRPRIAPPAQQQGQPQQQGGHQQGFPDDDDEDDDVTEIREGDDSNDYYEGYDPEQYDDGSNLYGDGSQGQGTNQAMPPPGGATTPQGGPQLMGLLCPNCRTMCQGVQALKDHMLVCTGQAPPRQGGYPPSGGQPMAANMREEDPQECHVCDKSFKSHRTLDNHMKKQHGISAPPKPPAPRGKPRRPKKMPVVEGEGDGWQGPGYPQVGASYNAQPNQQYHQGYPEGGQGHTPVKQSVEHTRPVGQVAPAQRSMGPGPGHSPAQAKPENPPEVVQRPPSADGARGMPSPRARGRGAPMGRGMPPRPGPPHMRGGQEGPRPDLQKLGLKFGGQISITSTGNQARRGGQPGPPGDVQGVSITKLKGDIPIGSPVSIRDATTHKQGQGGSTPSRGDTQASQELQVKEEPNEFEMGDGQDESDMGTGEHGEDFGDYGEEGYSDMGPGGDGMYADGEEFDEMGEEGMEGDEEFSGRGGMFQGQYADSADVEPDMEGEYEDEG